MEADCAGGKNGRLEQLRGRAAGILEPPRGRGRRQSGARHRPEQSRRDHHGEIRGRKERRARNLRTARVRAGRLCLAPRPAWGAEGGNRQIRRRAEKTRLSSVSARRSQIGGRPRRWTIDDGRSTIDRQGSIRPTSRIRPTYPTSPIRVRAATRGGCPHRSHLGDRISSKGSRGHISIPRIRPVAVERARPADLLHE